MNAAVPPQDAVAEKCLIGSILLVSSVLDDVSAILVAEDFYLDSHQRMYREALRLHTKGGPVDAALLAAGLETAGSLNDCGGVDYLIECMESVPHAAHAVHYAKIIAEKSQRRALSFVGTEAIGLSANLSQPVEDSVGLVEQSLSKILERQAGHEVQDIGAILVEAMQRIGAGKARGLLSRYKSLDQITNGFEGGNLVIIAARPSIGKTALAINIAYQLAMDGTGVGVLSLEQTRHEIAERLLGIDTRIGTDNLRGIGLTESQSDAIMTACERMSKMPLSIDACEHRGIAAIEASARLMVRKRGAKILFVDYLQMISAQERHGNREQEVAEVSRRLKFLAKSLSVPVVALAQINRENEKRTDKRPRMADLRESGAIEADADIVLLLHRDEYYDPEMNPGEAVVIVAKNRNGPTGEIRLHFDKRIMLFKDLAPEYVARSASSFDWNEPYTDV